MSIKVEQQRAEQALIVLRQIMEEEVLISSVVVKSRFVLRKLSYVRVVAFTTTNNWKFEMVLEDEGVSFVRSARGPDGQEHLGSTPIAIYEALTGPEKSALDTEIYQAIASAFPS